MGVRTTALRLLEAAGFVVVPELRRPEAVPNGGASLLYTDRLTGKLRVYSRRGGDRTLEQAAGGGSGDVVGPSSSVASEVALFDGTTGKLIKRATGSGLAKLTSGVLSVAAAGTDYYAPGSTDVTVADGGTGASTAAGARTNLGLEFLGFYGDGSDGSLNFDGAATVLGMAPSSGVYTFTREVFATDVTVGSGVRLALESFGLYVNGTLTGTDATSFISANGLPASGVTAGGQQTAAAPFHFVSTGGGTGKQTTSGAGAAGGTANPSPCGAGGNGGAAGANAGGNGGTVVAAVASRGGSRSLDWVFRKCRYFDAAALAGAHGGSGGGGGGLTTGGGSGGGGGGGGGARAAVVFARLVAGTGYIEANGGAGGNSTAAGGHAGGGGGGGGGGAAILITSSPTPSWTVRANGGAFGTGAGGGSNGNAGAAGLALTFIL